MAKVDWAILCDFAFYAEGRKISMIGVFDRIWTQNVPVTHHQAALCIRIVGEPGERVSFNVEIIRPTGGSLGGSGIKGDVQLGSAGTAEVIVSMENLPLPDYGIYALNIHVPHQDPRAVSLAVLRPPSKEIGQD